MSGVMGSLVFGGVPTLACACLIPVRIYSKSGIDLVLKRSPRPCCIFAKWIPYKYDFMV